MSQSEVVGEVIVRVRPVMDEQELQRVVEQATAVASAAQGMAGAARNSASRAALTSSIATNAAAMSPSTALARAGGRPGFVPEAYSVTIGEPFDAQRAISGSASGSSVLTTPLASFPALPFIPAMATLTAPVATSRAAEATVAASNAGSRAGGARTRTQGIFDELDAMPALGPDSSRRTIEGRQARLRSLMNAAVTPELEEAIGRQYGRNLGLLNDMSAGAAIGDEVRQNDRRRRNASREASRSIQRVNVQRAGSGGMGGGGGPPPFAGMPFPSPFGGGSGGSPPARRGGRRGGFNPNGWRNLHPGGWGAINAGAGGGGGGIPPINIPPGAPGGPGRGGGGGGNRGGGFLGRPNSMGLFMNFMFGSWEVSNALQASGEASRIASYYPGDFKRQAEAELAAVDAASGGILGSVAGLIADPMRSRATSARTMLAGGEAGNALAGMKSDAARSAMMEDLGIRAGRAGPLGRGLFAGIRGDIELEARQTADMDQRRQLDAEAHAAVRSRYVRGVTDSAGAVVTLGTSNALLGWAVQQAGPTVAEAFFGDDITEATKSDADDRRSQQNAQVRRNRAQRRRGLLTPVDELDAVLRDDFHAARDLRTLGPILGAAQTRKAEIGRSVRSANEGLDAVAEQLERLGFDRPNFAAMRGLLNEWQQTQGSDIDRQVNQTISALGAPNRAQTAVLGYANRGMPWEAQREAFRQAAEAQRNSLRINFPAMDDATLERSFGVGGRLDAELESVNIDERNTRASVGINLDTRRRVSQSWSDVKEGRRSRFAPALESLYGNYRDEIESMRNSGMGDRAGELSELYTKEVEAMRDQFFSNFKVRQYDDISAIPFGNPAVKNRTKDFDEALVRGRELGGERISTRVNPTSNSYLQVMQERWFRRELDANPYEQIL